VTNSSNSVPRAQTTASSPSLACGRMSAAIGRCTRCPTRRRRGLPEGERDPGFKTKPQLATELVQAARQAGIGFRAVVADCFYGDNPGFTDALTAAEIPFVLALRPARAPGRRPRPLIRQQRPRGNSPGVALVRLGAGAPTKSTPSRTPRPTSCCSFRSWPRTPCRTRVPCTGCPSAPTICASRLPPCCGATRVPASPRDATLPSASLCELDGGNPEIATKEAPLHGIQVAADALAW
jgi:hypothetical protein